MDYNTSEETKDTKILRRYIHIQWFSNTNYFGILRSLERSEKVINLHKRYDMRIHKIKETRTFVIELYDRHLKFYI